MCRRGFEIALMHENFRNDFKVALDICDLIDDISSDNSVIMNGTPSESENSSWKNHLDEQHSMVIRI